MTVAAAGVFLFVVGATEVGLRVFSSALVVAVVSAALWCRDWRLALLAAVLLALFLVASAASRWQVCAARCWGCSRRLRPACGAAYVGDDLCRRICPRSAYLRPYTRGRWRRVDLRRRGPPP